MNHFPVNDFKELSPAKEIKMSKKDIYRKKYEHNTSGISGREYLNVEKTESNTPYVRRRESSSIIKT